MTLREIEIEAARKKARNLLFMKPAAKGLALEDIHQALYDMAEACADVAWYMDDRDNALEDVLDEDEAQEFKTEFANLAADVERMQESFDEIWLPEYYNDFTAAIQPTDDMWGFDAYENDFFQLDSYAAQSACLHAKERMMRKTKSELIDCCHTVTALIVQYLGIKQRFELLTAAYDVILERAKEKLSEIEVIERLYNEAEAEKLAPWLDTTKRLDSHLAALPDRIWVE